MRAMFFLFAASGCCVHSAMARNATGITDDSLAGPVAVTGLRWADGGLRLLQYDGPRGPRPAHTMSKLAQMLAEAAWTRGLTPDQRRRVDAETFSRIYPKGSHIFHHGEQVDYWMGVVDGLGKMAMLGRDGRATTFVAVGSGAWFGEGSIIKHVPRQYEGVALRNSEIAFVPRKVFMSLLDENIAFNRFIIDILNERLQQFIGLASRDRLLEPEARVALSIASLFNPVLSPRTERTLAITQDEIAELSGLSRQRTNEALRFLEDQGMLRIERVGLTVVDLKRLQTFR
jgi:CRP/FNR family cyclic AMP-dependent transcriptional regulator